MKKLNLMIILLLMFTMVGCAVQQDGVKSSSDEVIVFEPTNENFLMMLRTNLDGKEYSDKNRDVYVLNVSTFYPSEINMSEEDFKDLYSDLPEKKLYRVDFGSKKTSLVLMSVIDLEEKEVLTIFGLMIMGMG